MGAFIDSLNTFEMVCFVIAAISTVIIVIQTILEFVGADIDSDFDTQGFHLITTRGVVAFFMVGGLAGLIASRAGVGELLSVIFAVVCGGIALFGIAKLMQALMKLHSDGSLDVSNALGQTGTVYIRIPAEEKGVGKVNVTVQERLCEFDAVTEGDETIKTGELICVTAVRPNNVLVVERAVEVVK